MQNRLPHTEATLLSKTPDYPWQKVACDFLNEIKNLRYLPVIGYSSRYVEVACVHGSNKAKLDIVHLK